MYVGFQQRKYKIETEVENWIQKFDSDMGERQVTHSLIILKSFHLSLDIHNSHFAALYIG